MSFQKNVLSSLFLLVTTVFASCSTTSSLPSPTLKPIPAEAQQSIKAQNKFGFTLFQLINQSNPGDQNKLISPLSIFMDLSMVYNGADSQTKTAMAKALQLHDVDTGSLNKTNALLLHNLPLEDSSVTIDIANAIWYRQSLSLRSSFNETNQKYYKAKLQSAPFNGSTVKDINNWVKEKTHHKIKSIIDQISPSDLMFLLNAVYFKGDWQNKFDKDLTRDRKFHAPDQTLKVPFMYSKETLAYGENDSLQIARLPYGKGKFSMYILLPKQKQDIHSLISSLNSASFSALSAKMSSKKIKLYLPKWEASYKKNLNKELADMGMGIAFSNHADFSKIFKKKSAKISDVKHKTYIKVDEEGTEAAAVTSTGMRATAMPINPPSVPVMDVDHPFVYLITEKESGSILFLGVVNSPNSK